MKTTQRVLFASLLFIAACDSGGSSKDTTPGGDASAGNNGGGNGGGASGDAGSDSGATGGDVDAGSLVAPAAFALESPVNGDAAVSTMPKLTWAASSGARSYEVEVSSSAAFDAASTTKTAGVTSTSLTLTSALKPGVIYYWRVTAVNGAGSVVSSGAPYWMSSPASVGSTPRGIAVTKDGVTAVVANGIAAGSVTLVDLATFGTQAIAVTGLPGVVAITPDGTKALVPQVGPNAVSVVDLASKSVSGTITPACAATTLYGIAIKPDGSGAVMPDLSSGCTKDVLDIIPLPGTTVANTIDLGSSATALGVALTPDGSTALVTRGITTTSIKRVDLGTSNVSNISGTSSSYGVAVTPDGQTAIVTSGPGDKTRPITLATNTVGTAIDFESNTEVCNVAITPDGKHAVVAGPKKVGVLSISAGTVVSTHAFAGACVAIAPDGAKAFVTGAGVEGKLHVLKLP